MSRRLLYKLAILVMIYINYMFSEQYSGYPDEANCVFKYHKMVFVDTTGNKMTLVPYYSKFKFNSASDDPLVGRVDTKDDGFRYISYRLCFKWDLHKSVPKNAKVTGAFLEIWCSNVTTNRSNTNTVDLNAKVLSLDNFTTNYAKVAYDAIKSGGSYFSHSIYVGKNKYEKYDITELKSFQNAIGDSVPFCMAFMTGDDEGYGEGDYRYILLKREYVNSEKVIKVRLTINYYIPFEVTVVNSFGAGKINVDGNPNVAHGTKFSWKSTDTPPHTLLAYQQECDGKLYVPSGTWTNITKGQILNQNPITITEWKDATYQANYAVLFVIDTIKSIYSSGDLTPVGVASWEDGVGFVTRANPWVTYLKIDSTYCFKAYNDILSDEKYNTWKINYINESEVKNHRMFLIRENTKTIISQFKPTFSGIKIKVDLLEIPGQYNNNIEFKDPWLIDSVDATRNNSALNRGMSALFKSQTTPFSPDANTQYKGVFLMQGYPNWEPPYYSVRAMQEQMIGSYKGCFVKWSAHQDSVQYQDASNRETPVVFKQPGATATALYKAHLGTSTLQATATINGSAYSSNQRKVAIDDYDVTHIVYTSAGMVFYTRNYRNDDEKQWYPEKLIGNGKNPCISINREYIEGNLSIVVHIVWEQETAGGKRRVCYMRSTDQGISWDSMKSTPEYTGPDATPVVFGYSFPVVVWRGNDGLYGCLKPWNGLNGVKLEGTGPQSQLPTGAEDPTNIIGNKDKSFYLVTAEDGQIYYRYFKVPWPDYNTFWHMSNRYKVSLSSTNTNPTIASCLYSDSICIAWENTQNGSICYRALRAGYTGESILGAIQEFSQANNRYSCPSLCISASDEIGITLLWQRGENICGVVRNSLTGWGWSQVIDFGQGSGVSVAQSEDIVLPAVICSRGSQAPYSLSISSIALVLSGEITENTYWPGNIIISGTVTVRSGVTLTISAGTNIKVNQGASIIVNGTLNINGEQSDRVVITRSGSSGSWGGIRFNSGSSGTISYCDISNATTGISCNNTSLPQISNVNITNCTTQGIYLYNSSPRISYCNIANNGTYGIVCVNYSSPIMHNNGFILL